MSPNEAQLRAALRDGEGDVPNADAVISHALRLRYDRRKRFTAIAGGAVAAAAVGVGTTVLVALGGNGNVSGSSADKAGAPAASTAGSARSSGAGGIGADPHRAPVSQGAAPKITATELAGKLSCPAVPDRFVLPGGGGSGQFGSSDPLFASPVAAMKVCVYPARAGAGVRSLVVGHAEAAAFGQALDAAPAQRAAVACPANTNFVGGTIEILAVDALGRTLKPVAITLECTSSQATNGTAVRYVTDIPDRFLGLLVPSSPKSISNTAPGQGQNSPSR